MQPPCVNQKDQPHRCRLTLRGKRGFHQKHISAQEASPDIVLERNPVCHHRWGSLLMTGADIQPLSPVAPQQPLPHTSLAHGMEKGYGIKPTSIKDWLHHFVACETLIRRFNLSEPQSPHL